MFPAHPVVPADAAARECAALRGKGRTHRSPGLAHAWPRMDSEPGLRGARDRETGRQADGQTGRPSCGESCTHHRAGWVSQGKATAVCSSACMSAPSYSLGTTLHHVLRRTLLIWVDNSGSDHRASTTHGCRDCEPLRRNSPHPRANIRLLPVLRAGEGGRGQEEGGQGTGAYVFYLHFLQWQKIDEALWKVRW